MQLATAYPLKDQPAYRLSRHSVSRKMMTGNGAKGQDSQDPATLLAKVAKKDRAAFAQLFAQLAPRIKAYLIGLGSDPASAEDLAQDVMVTIWHKAEKFDPTRASAMTWVFVIARNRRIDGLRREKSAVTYGHTPPDREDETPLADDQLAGAHADEKMRQAIAGLPADQQEVIRRSFFEDQPHSAIADALNLPLGTVKSRLRIAFTKLRARMEEFQ